MLQNAGPEQMIDLLTSRVDVAESTMQNLIAEGVYSDGTGAGGKEITGLDAMIPSTATASQADTYGGIDRATWAFWRSKSAAGSYATMLEDMNAMWASLVRGADRPDRIIMDYLAGIGRASCRERVCQYVEITGGA